MLPEIDGPEIDWPEIDGPEIGPEIEFFVNLGDIFMI